MTTATEESTSTAERTVVSKEFRFAVHIPTRDPEVPDYHMVKETVHYSDKTSEQKLKLYKDYKRPIWVTKPTARNHKEKKEFEKLDNLLRRDVTQSDMRLELAKMLEKGWGRDSVRELSASPYVYGADISTSTIIKKMEYFNKYPNVFTPHTICTFDTETDVVRGTGEIIMASACFETSVVIAVDKVCLEGYASALEMFEAKAKHYLKEYIEKYNLKIIFHICENEMETLRKVFGYIHKWRPDWLAIWNMDFDIPKVLQACERAGVDPKDLLCDPAIPKHLRVCKYKEGQKKKIAASGKAKPINPADQWHTLFLTASFYVIDSMCVYRQLRLQAGEEQSYSLDAILTKVLEITKLKFDAADAYTGLAWHQFLQANYIFEYGAYNGFDSYSMLLLDDKLKDLAFTVPTFTATTDFHDFKSQPKRIRDALFWFALEKHGKVLASVGPSVKPVEVVAVPEGGEGEDDEEFADPEDEDTTLDRRNWIITLPSHMSILGNAIIEEDPTVRTGIRGFVYDSDVVSSYPTCTLVANVSKGTTRREIIRIGDVDETLFRMQNLNIVFGETNALSYCINMFNMPKPVDLLQAFTQMHP